MSKSRTKDQSASPKTSSNGSDKHSLRSREILKMKSKKNPENRTDKVNRPGKIGNEKLVWMSDDEIYEANDPAINRSREANVEQINTQRQGDVNIESPFDEEADPTNDGGYFHGEQYEHAVFRRKSEKKKEQNASDDEIDLGQQRRSSKKEKKRYDDLKKDWAATNQRIDALAKDLKRVVSSMKRNHPNRSVSSDDELDIEEYDLLPRLPLKKIAQVILMNNDIDGRAYLKQLIAMLRTEGGEDIKKNVINIFNLLFSPKLKTKFCWRGSKKGKGKEAFKNLRNIQMVIRQAVKYRHKKCSAADIKKECKLRFKQAQKDYDRQKAMDVWTLFQILNDLNVKLGRVYL